MKSRRHRAIYWAYTGQKKRHKVTRSTVELEARFNIVKALRLMANKALNTIGEAVSKWGIAIRNARKYEAEIK